MKRLLAPESDDIIKAALRVSDAAGELPHVSKLTGIEASRLRTLSRSTEPLSVMDRGTLGSRLVMVR